MLGNYIALPISLWCPFLGISRMFCYLCDSQGWWQRQQDQAASEDEGNSARGCLQGVHPRGAHNDSNSKGNIYIANCIHIYIYIYIRGRPPQEHCRVFWYFCFGGICNTRGNSRFVVPKGLGEVACISSK